MYVYTIIFILYIRVLFIPLLIKLFSKHLYSSNQINIIMRYSISISIEPEHLELIDALLQKGENRSQFFVKAGIKEASSRQEEQQ